MDVATMIDHTLLKTDATRVDIDQLLSEAKQYHFASVCVSPIWVSYAAAQLRDTEVKTCTVIGFPQGATPTAVKVFVAAAKGKALTKVIIETCLLTDAEKRTACRLAQEAGADFVKTSTGFSAGGATAADVALMRETVGPAMGVKASGGVRSRADAEAMIAAGATRLGTSSGVKIVSAEG